MDLIGSIQYMENRLGGRKSDQRKGKPAQKNTRNDGVDEKNAQEDAREDASQSPTEYDTRLGRKLDTTA